MKKNAIVSIVFFVGTVSVFAEHNNSVRTQDIKERVLFQGKYYYDKQLQAREPVKKTKDIKLYKKDDGTIDTFRTYNNNKE